MKEFSSIESFRHVVKHVRENSKYHGRPLPTLAYTGTVKIHGCFSKDTLVTLANGSQASISTLRIGDKILSHDLLSGNHVPKEITEVFENDIPKDWIKLTFDNGNTIECTTDHKIFTKNRGWVEASNLTDSDEFITDF